MSRNNENLDVYILLFSGAALFICLAGFIIYFIFLYRSKQLKNQREKEAIKAHYDKELLRSELEIQESTLNHVSREIHDNIGQVLSFVKLSLGATKDLSDNEKQVRIEESRDLISHVINDLRDLSKSLSYETVAAKGLVTTLQAELERINRSGNYIIEFDISGNNFPLGQKRELVIFRIFQESMQNILKHSEANRLKINLDYSPEMFNLKIHDDGIGFSPGNVDTPEGSGLRNMKSRAKLIGATLSITSSPGKGCIINVNLPIARDLNFDGENPSGPG
ncbi:sensor histidine kinase [Flavihumibacter sp. R14]|nr:sensor histidine kinase [Flavihumibacter soli]